MSCRFDFAQPTVGILREFLSHFPGVAGGFFNHGGFQGIEAGEQVLGAGFVVIAGDGNAGCCQLQNLLPCLAYPIHICCVDGDIRLRRVTEFVLAGIVMQGFVIGDCRWVDGDFLLGKTAVMEEGDNLVILGLDIFDQCSQFVSPFPEPDRPDGDIGGDFLFRKPLGYDRFGSFA